VLHSEARILQFRIRIRIRYCTDTPGSRIHAVSTYPELNGSKTQNWIPFGPSSIRPSPSNTLVPYNPILCDPSSASRPLPTQPLPLPPPVWAAPPRAACPIRGWRPASASSATSSCARDSNKELRLVSSATATKSCVWPPPRRQRGAPATRQVGDCALPRASCSNWEPHGGDEEMRPATCNGAAPARTPPATELCSHPVACNEPLLPDGFYPSLPLFLNPNH
jgi:hypothetical protein